MRFVPPLSQCSTIAGFGRITLIILALATSLCAHAQDVGWLYSAQGKVDKRTAATAPWETADVGNRFQARHAVRTGLNGRGAVLFVDGVLVRLNENTFLEFKDLPAGERTAPVSLESGAAYFFTRESKRFPRIDTPVVSAAVRGTEFVVEVVNPDQTVITVINGEVDCRNNFGAVVAAAGEQVVTLRGQAPVKRIVVRPLDAVQWALYYPAIIDPSALQADPALGRSAAAYRRGDLAAAFEELASVPQPHAPPVALYEAALQLAVGQVTKAEQTLAGLAGVDNKQWRADYLAQRAIIALTNNRKDEALTLAYEATATSLDSAAAALAMSYVEQAFFRLPAAKTWAAWALNLQPQSGVMAARLAEVQLGFGELNAAVKTVEEGLVLAPQDARLLTVAGFTYLTRYNIAKALELFDRALALDSASGLPHLGRGLALIRRNKLAEGRRELEMAVHLEPTDSLFRSYLGKAYFEEKRDGLAAREYDIAKQYDPLDPTPYLYSAYQKLADYRPVEALWDLEDSIKLNDNRAVYRSRLLLDQDQAVRSVGLSQIFNQLGFVEAGRAEAIKSIDRDYSNFSAHLLLGGAYFDQPQLATASIAEELLARLLAPVNINSVRGESSFNEYTSLFDRQRFQYFLLSDARSADNFAQTAVRSTGAFDQFAYATVFGARYLGGYRFNDDQTLFSPGLLLQWQATPADILNCETIFARQDEGDPNIGFNPQISDKDRNATLENFTERLGYHHRFGPDSHLLGQVLYLHRSTTLTDKNEAAPYPFSLFSQQQNQHLEQRTEGVRAEVQQILDLSVVSVVAGGSLLDASVRSEETTAYIGLGTFVAHNTNDVPQRGERAYLYSTWHVGNWADLVLGGNYSHTEFSANTNPPFTNATRFAEQVTPKLGLVTYVTPQLTLRGTYLHTLGAAGTADLESIEPTQVAGFNQVFDELPATRTELYAVGLDYKFAKQTYFGLQLSQRNLTEPYGFASQNDGGANDLTHLSAKEQRGRAYCYQVINARSTATLDYTANLRQDHQRAIGDLSDNKSETHRVAGAVNYFHPTGWFLNLAETWRWQRLTGFDATTDGTRDFWMTDASIGYQFPKRYGVITFTVANIFDQSYHYQPVGIDKPLLPERSFNLRLALNF